MIEIKLKNGASEPRELVAAATLALRGLFNDGDLLALYDLASLAKDPAYKIFAPNEKLLKGRALLGPDGKLHASIRNIVLVSVKIDGDNISILDPREAP